MGQVPGPARNAAGTHLDWPAVSVPVAVPPELAQAQENAVVEMVPIPPVAIDLATRFDAAGHRLYLVGGSVRDALLGRPVGDLDFTTDARPDAVLALLSGWADAVWDTGIAFGTVGARRGGRRGRAGPAGRARRPRRAATARGRPAGSPTR